MKNKRLDISTYRAVFSKWWNTVVNGHLQVIYFSLPDSVRAFGAVEVGEVTGLDVAPFWRLALISAILHEHTITRFNLFSSWSKRCIDHMQIRLLNKFSKRCKLTFLDLFFALILNLPLFFSLAKNRGPAAPKGLGLQNHFLSECGLPGQLEYLTMVSRLQVDPQRHRCGSSSLSHPSAWSWL